MELSVSIPFKREGVSERTQKISNPQSVSVSIPFKREGVSELTTPKSVVRVANLVSIPFKREGVSEQKYT